MKFKAGDRVRIKSWEKIRETLDDFDYCEEIWFNPAMKKFCGKEVTLQLTNRGTLSEGNWDWAEAWLEPLPKTEKAVLVRGMSEDEVRFFLDGRARSIETIEVKRSLKEIVAEIYNKAPLFNFYVHANATVAIDDSGRHIGVARCNPNDAWDAYVGRALSKARAMKWNNLEQELLTAL